MPPAASRPSRRPAPLATLFLVAATVAPTAASAEEGDAPLTLSPVTVTGRSADAAPAGLAIDRPNSGGSRPSRDIE